MSDIKHTDGPWHYDQANDAIYNKHCLYICDAPRNNKHDKNLIVAAPELLEALEAIIDSGELPLCYSSPLVINAKKAIAKTKAKQ